MLRRFKAASDETNALKEDPDDVIESVSQPVLPFLRLNMKQGLGSILKVVAGIATLVCLLSPVTGMGMLVFVVALFVAMIAGVTSSHLGEGDDQGGFWPKDHSSSSSD